VDAGCVEVSFCAAGEGLLVGCALDLVAAVLGDALGDGSGPAL
jgi:hypothetical protein